MPSRLVTTAIILFWLGMTAWLIEREVAPMMIADEAPTYQVNLTDEIGSPIVNWVVFSDGKRIGSGTTSIHAQNDRTYEFRSHFSFDRFMLLGAFSIRRMESMYRVTEKGKLQAITGKVVLNTPGPKGRFDFPDRTLEIEGEVVNDELPLRMLIDGEENKLFPLSKIDVRQDGSIVNPMHPVSRLRGLWLGRSWKITMFNPLRGQVDKLLPGVAKQSMPAPHLIADVKAEKLQWHNKLIDCYKIEYHKPGSEELDASTWVRKSDGLVLKQQASHMGVDLAMERVPD